MYHNFSYTQYKRPTVMQNVDSESVTTMLLTWDSVGWTGITDVNLDGHDLDQETYKGILLIVGITLYDLRGEWERSDKTDHEGHKADVRHKRLT